MFHRKGIQRHLRLRQKKITTLVFVGVALFIFFDLSYFLTAVGEHGQKAQELRQFGDRFLDAKRDNSTVVGESTGVPEFLPHQARFRGDSYAKVKFGDWCYEMDGETFTYVRPIRDSELKIRKCRKRLPDALIVGAKNCGAGDLSHYLSSHPSVAIKPNKSVEVHFFDLHQSKGFNWYREQLLYATKKQIVMETTPQYLIWPDDCAKKVHDLISSKTRIVVVVCDPVQRALSDYTASVAPRSRTDIKQRRHYKIDTNFEKSIIDNAFSANSVNHYNEFIDTGMYMKHILRWLDYFPRNQLHITDGGKLKSDPYDEIHQLEVFLGIPDFFSREHFYFDEVKRLYCMSFPYRHCAGDEVVTANVPDVDYAVLDKLYEFYHPYDTLLSQMFNQTFSWMAKYQELF